MKKCAKNGCNNNNPQPLENFYKHRANKDGLQKHCKKCQSIFCRETNARHREVYNEKRRVYWSKHSTNYRTAQREKWLLTNYGITISQWDEMLEAQNGCCKICGVSQKVFKRRLHVDHCHKTGKVRALLCTNCNHLIGVSMENQNILINAIVYLNEHNRNSQAEP
mgnify:CR=1 FL=1